MIYRFLTIVFFLVLYGCSGGISGTGDGGPIIPNENEIEGTGDVASSPDSQMPRFAFFPEQLLLSMPRSLLTTPSDVSAEGNAVTSPASRLLEGITASVVDAIGIRIDLQLIDAHLATTPVSSSGAALCTTDDGLSLIHI